MNITINHLVGRVNGSGSAIGKTNGKLKVIRNRPITDQSNGAHVKNNHYLFVWFLTIYEEFAHKVSHIISLVLTWKSIWWVGILSPKNGGLLGLWGLFGGTWYWKWSLLSTNFYLVLACGLSVNNPGSLTWGGCSLVHFSLVGSLGSQDQRIREGRSHYGLGSWGRLCRVSSFGASEGRWDSEGRGREQSTG